MIPTSRRQPTHRRDENFKPRSEWKEQEGVTILSVYLPGFVQERIKMLIDEPTRTLKLQGLRWMQNNRMICFDELFTIPEDCDISKISYHFTFGVRMPKLVIAQTNPKEDMLSASPQEIINAKAQKDLEDVNTESASISNSVKKRIHDQNVKSQIPEILNNVEDKETQEKSNESSVDNEKEKAMEIVSKKNLKDLNEERKLLVNVGAAILVMVGFGAYTFYSYN